MALTLIEEEGTTDDTTTDSTTTTTDSTTETELTDTETASGDNLIDATADFVSDTEGEQRDDTIADATTVTADEETVSTFETEFDPEQTESGTSIQEDTGEETDPFEEIVGTTADSSGTSTSTTTVDSEDGLSQRTLLLAAAGLGAVYYGTGGS